MHYWYAGPLSTLLKWAPLLILVLLAVRIRGRGAIRVLRPSDAQDPKYQAWRENPLTPVDPPAGLALELGETAYYSGAAAIAESPIESSDLTTATGSAQHVRMVRMNVSTNVSMRVTGLGLSAGTASPAPAGSGRLTITNKRLIYQGNGEDITQRFDVPGTILLPVNIGITLVPQQGEGEAFLFRTGDPIAGIVLQRAMNKTLESVTPSAPSLAPSAPSLAPSSGDVTETPAPDPPKWQA